MTEPEAQPQGVEPPEQIWMSFDPELDVWFQSSEPPGCFRNKGITESPTLYVRADLPRAIADTDHTLCHERDESATGKIAALVNATGSESFGAALSWIKSRARSSGETTVEAALAELREMLPHYHFRITFCYDSDVDLTDQRYCNVAWIDPESGEDFDLVAATIDEAIIAVRAATRTEGEKSSERSL